ncbi:MAG: class I lanthipeptide [Phycisphaerae bacterium]|nr:class I lanthipeptide [Phycisphaerae bacterium]
MKKLVLNKETVRVLQDSELRRVAGGIPDVAHPVHTWDCVCPTCGSTTSDYGEGTAGINIPEAVPDHLFKP